MFLSGDSDVVYAFWTPLINASEAIGQSFPGEPPLYSCKLLHSPIELSIVIVYSSHDKAELS